MTQPIFNKRSKHIYGLCFLIAVALLATLCSNPALAKPEDPIEPALLTTSDLRGNLTGSGKTSYYYFTGGPGEVIFTLDVTAVGSLASAKLELLDETATPLAQEIVAQATGQGSDQKIQKISLSQSKPVILGITDNKDMTGASQGSYRLRLVGATGISAPGPSTEMGPNPGGGSPYLPSPGQVDAPQQSPQRPQFVFRIITKKHGTFSFSFDIKNKKRPGDPYPSPQP
jgi:hypothetical protein